MENWIERASLARKLFLAWQAPDHMGDRFRWAVGVLEPRDDVSDVMLRYFQAGPEFEALNQKRSFRDLMALGYQGYPAFSLKRELHEGGVSEVLMRRLPPRSRPDFDEYRRQFRLGPRLELSNFALLGLTEGRLPSDGFSVVDPLDPEAKECEVMLEIAGFRYYVREAPLDAGVGHPVDIRPEPDNEHDPNAVQICIGQRKIGNVNRLQAPTFLQWLRERRVSGIIERLNGRSERPRAFIFVRVRPAQALAAA